MMPPGQLFPGVQSGGFAFHSCLGPGENNSPLAAHGEHGYNATRKGTEGGPSRPSCLPPAKIPQNGSGGLNP